MHTKAKKSKSTHFNNPGDAHALTFTCYRNRKFLNYNRTRKYIIDALNIARVRFNFDIWAYVIMPEHVHLLIYPRQEIHFMDKIIRAIKQPVARKTTNYLRTEKPTLLYLLKTAEKHHPYRFWQDGFGFDQNISNKSVLDEFMDYCHENPVKRGLVENSVDWYWSSARDWLLDIDGPLRIDKEFYPIS